WLQQSCPEGEQKAVIAELPGKFRRFIKSVDNHRYLWGMFFGNRYQLFKSPDTMDDQRFVVDVGNSDLSGECLLLYFEFRPLHFIQSTFTDQEYLIMTGQLIKLPQVLL